MPDHPSDSLNLSDYLRPLRSRWWLVLVIAAIATIGTYVYYDAKPSEYSATTTLFLERAALGGATLDPDRDARNRAVLLKTVDVAREVARDIGYRGNPRNLLARLSVSASEGTDFLTLTTSGTDPQATARLTNKSETERVSVREALARVDVELAQITEALELKARRATPKPPQRGARRPTRPGATQKRILDAVARLPQPVSPAEIIAEMEATGPAGNRGTIHNAIGRLVKIEELNKLDVGQYQLASRNGSAGESHTGPSENGTGEPPLTATRSQEAEYE